MKHVIVENIEKDRILKMHNNLREQSLSSNVKAQDGDTVGTEQPNNAPAEDIVLKQKEQMGILQNAIKQGCIAKYTWFVPDTTKPIRQKKDGNLVIYGKGGDDYYFFYADMTVENITTKTKRTWVCERSKQKVEMPKPAEQNPKLDALRQQWLEFLDKKGYITNPNETQKTTLQSINVEEVGVPAGVFAKGTVVWYDPQTQENLTGSTISNKLKSEEINRSTCRKYVEDFYTAFKRSKGLQITNKPELAVAKRRVQACKNQFYPNKWGILGGGQKLNQMIQVLSGEAAGGPTSSGADSIFRIS